MSLINDALKRASQVHKQGPQDRGVMSGSPLQPVVGGRQRKRSPNVALMVLPVLIVLALGGSIWFFMQWRKSTHKTPAGPPAAATAAKPGAKPATTPAKPVSNASTPAVTPPTPATTAAPAATAPAATPQVTAQTAPSPAPAAGTPKPAAAQATPPKSVATAPAVTPAPTQVAPAEAQKPTVPPTAAQTAPGAAQAAAAAPTPATNASQKSIGSSVSKLFGGGKTAETGKNGAKLFPNIKLQGIFFRIKDPSVLINGRSMVVGEEIEGAVIKKIERSTVTFEFQGETRVVSLR